MSSIISSAPITKLTKLKLNNGTEIPVAGFGVYEIEVASAADLVYQALAAGYRHIDSAVGYNNEKESAQGIANFLKDHPEVKRLDVYFTTKITNGAHGYDKTKKQIQQIADDVKESLGYVDLILVHSPLSDKKRRLETWKALQEHTVENDVLLIKSIGVSNYGINHIEEIYNWEGYKVKPVVNQVELHPWLPRTELIKWLFKENILPEAYSPLTRGEKFSDPELTELATKSGILKPDILLKWGYIQGFIVLAKTAQIPRIKQNLDALPDSGSVELPDYVTKALHKPDSVDVLTWGGNDPTLYKDPVA